MVFLACIVALWLIYWWYIIVDWPVLLAPSAAANALSYRQMLTCVLVMSILALLLPATQTLAINNTCNLSVITPPAGVLIAATVFITVLITYQISKFTAVCYAFMGSLLGLQIYLEGNVDWDANLKIFFSWLSAPFVSVILCFIIYRVYNYILSRISFHLLKIIYYQRFIITIGLLSLAFALGVNNGSVLLGFTDLIMPESRGFWHAAFPVLAVVSLAVIFSPVLRPHSGRMMRRDFNINSQAVTSVVLASAITLALYSSETICGFAGLKATPLSVCSLVMGAMVGLSIAGRKEVIGLGIIVKSVVSVMSSPVLAVLISYCLFFIFDVQNPKINGFASSLNSKRIELDIYLLAVVIVAIIFAIMIMIIFQQQKAHKVMERIAHARQEQLNENLKALNETEVRGVLIESQGLDSTIDIKREELLRKAYNICDQKTLLDSLYQKIVKLKTVENAKNKSQLIDEVQDELKEKMLFAKEIDNFHEQAEVLYKDFLMRVNEAFPNLTPQEKKLTVFLRLGFSSKLISSMMNISPKSVEIGRYRLRSKFDLKREDNLVKFIQSL